MGNGTFGDASGSTAISGFSLDNGSAAAQLSVADTNAAWYDHGGTTGTSFRFGGPAPAEPRIPCHFGLLSRSGICSFMAGDADRVADRNRVERRTADA